MNMSATEKDLLVISGEEVKDLLMAKEAEIIELVRLAYIAHEQGRSFLPHSTFLRFPDNPRNRIIGLPAYLQDEGSIAGFKWVASFPDNVLHGMERASAIIALNSTETGRPYCLAEGSMISAKRTAASAVLGAQVMGAGIETDSIGLVGCGPINFEILRFAKVLFPHLRKVYLYDLDANRVQAFLGKGQELRGLEFIVESTLIELTQQTQLVSLATTSSTPYIDDLNMFKPRSRILHVSLRDLGTRVIRESINITDDRNHVNREGTSINLAINETEDENLIFADIGALLLGKKELPHDDRTIVFSPFGLGILDLQLARYVHRRAIEEKRGVRVPEFLPNSWTT